MSRSGLLKVCVKCKSSLDAFAGNELMLLVLYHLAKMTRLAFMNQDVQSMASKAQRAGSECTASSGARQLALFRAAEI